jgi:uncharacterized protein (UPF0147 family)
VIETEEKIKQAVEVLSRVKADTMTPRSARSWVEQALSELSGPGDPKLKAASAANYLDRAGSDPNLPPHIRTAIWSVLSILESMR